MNFTSRLTQKETIAALAWIPMHILIIPWLLRFACRDGMLDIPAANLVLYVAGTLYMLVMLGRFLRSEFDPLCDRFFFCLLQVAGSYVAMIAFNAAFASILVLISGEDIIANPNNQAVTGLAEASPGIIRATGIFLAPIVEEMMFRAGIFGAIHKRSRVLAYIVSMLAFGIYHVWSYLPENPLYIIFIVQYLPVSWLLCRCYEKTDTVWTPVFLHMLINAVSMTVVERLAAI